jgi:dTDP-4-dehydrorhamnose 3,5-epimerase
MIDGVIIKEIPIYEDERGWLRECYRADSDGIVPRMCYVSRTRPGVVRGPHEHQFQTDFFLFIGPGDFELHLWDNRPTSPTYKEYMVGKYGAKSQVSVTVPPGVVHGYKNIDDVHSMSINLPDQLYRGEGKVGEVDEIRHEDLDDEFKID